MPKSRDTSPASHDSSARSSKADEETTTAPPLLEVPEETTQSSQTTRPRSPARLSSELQVRAKMQEERLDTMLSIVEDLQASTAKEPLTIIASEVEITKTTLMEMHLMFHQEHQALSRLWPVSQLDHGYYKTKVASQEEKVVLTARKLIAQLEHRLAPSTTTQTTTSTQSTSTKRSRLPEIALPKFEGEYNKWQAFKSAFTSVILDRDDLADVDKLHYLKGAVSGNAAHVIAHLPATNEAFQKAWKLLDERFENKRLNVQAYMDRISELKPMKQRRASSLIKMTNIIGETQEALTTFGLNDQHYCFLLSHLVRLLDSDTRERWESSLSTQTDYPTMSQLTTFLLGRARTLEQLERVAEQKQNTQNTQTTSGRPASRDIRLVQQRASVHAAAAAQSTTTTTTSSARPRTSALYPCALCAKDHFLTSCPAFRDKTVDERISVVKAQQLCVNCLGHHNLRSCRTAQRCKLCNEQHHTALHGGNLIRVLVPFPQTSQPATASTSSQPTAKASQTTQTQSAQH
ncbi:uncharacterized protein LOC123989000 [Osmia bicornis bicornis]|uniref:uncharacterized protein LOC123989000 n=1 Tax=Osmia bicornis bicornis TaxID=1437191 RepID=UPI001EAEB8CF|nr:uncharacterized protein LOC123989000 [Osmia bicornis bicornis]